MNSFTLVPQSRDALPLFQDHTSIGLDTEFMRERTYFAELCLVQVAAGKTLFGVDPLLNDDQADFWRETAEREWIVHSARQDLEVIYQTAGVLPVRLFDTQVAAGLAGHAPQLGYAGLVKALFDVELPKSHTRANWAERPLPAALLEYAAEDVEYLLPIRDALAESLDKLGRLEWAAADSTLLLDRALYEPDSGNAVERLKGARNLKGQRRAAATLLAHWREERAIRRNKPRQWILRDPVLLDIANRLPDSMDALKSVPNLPPQVARKSGAELLDLVRQSASRQSGYQPPPVPDEAQKALLKKMQKIVADVAGDLGLASEIVASRKDLSAAIIRDDRSSRVFRDWRRQLVGNDLLALL
jgi:ribonuclease D